MKVHWTIIALVLVLSGLTIASGQPIRQIVGVAGTVNVAATTTHTNAVCPKTLGFSVATASQLITPTAGQFIEVCAIALFEQVSETASLAEGSGTLCASTQQPFTGTPNGITGTNPFIASGGFTLTPYPGGWTQVSGNGLCIFKSTTGTSSGSIFYYQGP